MTSVICCSIITAMRANRFIRSICAAFPASRFSVRATCCSRPKRWPRPNSRSRFKLRLNPVENLHWLGWRALKREWDSCSTQENLHWIGNLGCRHHLTNRLKLRRFYPLQTIKCPDFPLDGFQTFAPRYFSSLKCLPPFLRHLLI